MHRIAAELRVVLTGTNRDGALAIVRCREQKHMQIVGRVNGNAFAVLGRVQKALKRANVSQDNQDRFTAEAVAGDYDHLLGTVMRWVEVD